jgi:DNA-binding transcriptional ArsR family regulator
MTSVNADQITELADTFSILGDGTRLSILLACLNKELSVGSLVQELQLSQSLVSHHLRLLKAARLVKARREGKYIYYCSADSHISTMLQNMIHHIGHEDCDDEKEQPT